MSPNDGQLRVKEMQVSVPATEKSSSRSMEIVSGSSDLSIIPQIYCKSTLERQHFIIFLFEVFPSCWPPFHVSTMIHHSFWLCLKTIATSKMRRR